MLNTLRNVDPLSYVVLVVIALYIALVNPSNTPAIFSNPIFKFVLFVFVGLVCILEGSAIGVLCAVAMAWPVVYSSLREGYENPFVEGFEDDHSPTAEGDEQEGETVSHHHKMHQEKREARKEKREEKREERKTKREERKEHRHSGSGHSGIQHTRKPHPHHHSIQHTPKPHPHHYHRH